MKKLIASAVGALVAVVVFAVVYPLGSGRGGYFTATTTAQQITMSTTNGMDGSESFAVCISVQNLGTNTIFAGHDFPNAAMFDRAVVNNEAIPIDSMEYYEFHGVRLLSLWVKTTNSTSQIKIGAY